MALTPEQFNKLVTKDDLKELTEKVDLLGDGMGKLLTAVDGLAKKVDDIEHAFVSNIAAHDRFEERIIRIEKVLKLQPVA
jgi:hypothetical protein